MFAVFQSDIGDDAQDRRDDIGRIKPAAQTGLDDGDVHRLSRKEIECHARRYLEERRLVLFEKALPTVEESLDKIFRNHPEGIPFHDLHPLTEIHQMR